MLEGVLIPDNLVYLAGAFYIVGLAITNQIVLRILILAGTCLYLVYYSVIADSPLWPAIYVSLLIGLANLGGLTSLFARSSRLAIPAAHADIYFDFPRLPPGDFRALMKLARRFKVAEDRQVTVEGDPGKLLYFVIRGSTLVHKGDQAFVLAPKQFVGEIAFLTGAPSSASAWLEEGAEVLEWHFDDLRRRCARNARFKLALEAAISVNLACKVGESMGRYARRIDTIPEFMIDALGMVQKR